MIGQLSLSRFKLAGPPTPRDTEVSNAYAIIHDSLVRLSQNSRFSIFHIPHPFFWVYEGFRGMLFCETWPGPLEPCLSMSLGSCLTSSRRCGAS
jgi:hypothetical protein